MSVKNQIPSLCKFYSFSEAVDGTLLQFRDAACDELARATNVSVVEANGGDDGLPDQSRDSFVFIRSSREKISQKLLVSVVLKGLPDSYEYFNTVHDFSKTPTPFSDLKKALKNFADSQKLKDCGNSSNTKSEAALFVSRDNSKKFSGKCFRCNKSGHMNSSCTVEQCSFCKKFGHNESKCFQKSKLDKKSENSTNFSQSCEFSFFFGSDCSKSRELILDSGCTSHTFCHKDFFVELHDVSSKICVNANNSVSPVKGQCCQNFFA